MAQALSFRALVPYMTACYMTCATIFLIVTYWVIGCIYNIYFHPLSKFPGPKAAAITRLWHSKHWVGGRYPQTITALHQKYGTVMRIAPNALSFSSPTSWRDIYGHTTGRATFLKTEWYNDGTHPNLASSRDPEQHSRMLKLLNSGFSSKALLEQEDIIQEYINVLITQLNVHATGKSADMTQWYNFAAFDIVGDLSFGEPFGSLKALELHFWPALIMDAIKALAWISELGAYPRLKAFIPYIVPKKAMAARVRHWQYANDKITKSASPPSLERVIYRDAREKPMLNGWIPQTYEHRRMNTVTSRKDFMSKILENKEAQGVTTDEMQAHASVMVLAGSETIATSLSGITYYLCRNPEVYKKLTTEIREAFSNYDDIKGQPTEKLSYLKAVIEEELRIFPGVPFGMPRYSPGEVVDGHFIPKGVIVSTMSYAATHDPANFHRPYEFIPERWLDPNCKDIKEASQPFLLGSRSCIGRNLAMMELRTILAKMLWVFDMQLMDDNLDWNRDATSYLVWKRPELFVKYTRRPGIYVPPIDNWGGGGVLV